MKHFFSFFFFLTFSTLSFSQSFLHELPYTWRQSMPNGFMECTVHEDGTITSVMCAGCYSCNGFGLCQVCMGNGRRYIPTWNSFMTCGSCLGSGQCGGCNGKGYSVINTTTQYGVTIGVDENGKVYMGGSSGSGGGSSKSYVEKIEDVPCYGVDCDTYCKKCDKVTRRHVHLKIRR